jgi:hypothetical protein
MRKHMSEARRWWQSRRTRGGPGNDDGDIAFELGTQRRKVLWAPEMVAWCVAIEGVLARDGSFGNEVEVGGDREHP